MLAPALIQGGLAPMAVHLFILYWGMLSFITPPVALGAFAASAIAGASPLKTGFTAMRLGSVVYFIPFFFVIDPALVLDASVGAILSAALQAFAGVVLIAGALQGHLVGYGPLTATSGAGIPVRTALLLGGLLIATPRLDAIGIGVGDVALASAGVAATLLALLADRLFGARPTVAA